MKTYATRGEEKRKRVRVDEGEYWLVVESSEEEITSRRGKNNQTLKNPSNFDMRGSKIKVKQNESPQSELWLSAPSVFSLGCWKQSSRPGPPPWLGHTRLGKHISEIYTHAHNPGRVGLTPERNMNQLFCCSRIFDQSRATTMRDRHRAGVGGGGVKCNFDLA